MSETRKLAAILVADIVDRDKTGFQRVFACGPCGGALDSGGRGVRDAKSFRPSARDIVEIKHFYPELGRCFPVVGHC
jgi:hypothetical protein